MFERPVIPNEVRNVKNANESHNEICVSKASSGGSFPVRLRVWALRSGLRLFLQGSGACLEPVERLRMTHGTL
jgi:hypothetical protein